MVESNFSLDMLFMSLSDPTRRNILKRVSKSDMSVGAIADHYEISLAAVAKHLKVLERAQMIRKTRKGKEFIVTLEPQALQTANKFLENYRELWEQRFDSLEKVLDES